MLRLLLTALTTTAFILGGLAAFVHYLELKRTIEVQNRVMVELALLTAQAKVEAQTDRASGDVIVRLNENDKSLHYFPNLCPKVYTP